MRTFAASLVLLLVVTTAAPSASQLLQDLFLPQAPRRTVVPPHCNFVCTRIYDPVCGTDGKTYSNMCVLTYFACVAGYGVLGQLHEGACVVDRQCPTTCSRTKNPVCGSDGKTYTNECRLAMAACAGVSVTKTKDGPCAVNKNCDTACPFDYDPVCGSDGVTYSNQCTFGVATCKDPSITQRSKGACAPDPEQGQRPCPVTCPYDYAPVCGSDGNTYANECTLDSNACRDASLFKVSNGACGEGFSA